MWALSSVYLFVCLALGDATSQIGGSSSCPYPSPCECSGSDIKCWYKGQDEIPPLQNFSGSYTRLLLAGNNISFIGADVLPPDLVHLDLSDNPIRNISDLAFVKSSKTLRSVRFSYAKFDSVPSALEVLDNLNSLHIHGCVIKNYPDMVMGELAKSVTDLLLDDVGLTAWPPWLDWFSFLRKLNLANNKMGSIPDNALDLWGTELLELDLHNTDPKNTSFLQRLKVLQYLDMRNTSLSDHALLTYNLIPCSSTLEYIDVRYNYLTELPRLEFFTRLTYARLNDNNIDKDNNGAFPESLRYLELRSNLFAEIPDSIKSLTKLHDLVIGNNPITRIGPDEFPVNSKLQSLHINDCPISAIDKRAFDNVLELTLLNMDGTSLTRLPLALPVLDKLSNLYMRNIDQLLCTCDEESVASWINKSPSLSVSGQCMRVDIQEFVIHMVQQCP